MTFDITIDGTNSPVDEGETLTVDYTVTNTGDTSDTQDITLNILSEWWATDIAWDNAQSESLVHHEQPAGTDWAAADTVELGYPSHDGGGAALEGYWPLDEDSGSTANDVSGNGHDGSVSGATLGEPGILGTTAYSFDGTDDGVTVSGFNWDGGPVTVAFWNYVPAAETQEASAFGGGDTGDNRFQAHAPYSNDVLYWDYGDTSGDGRISTDYSSYLDAWTHVALVSEGASGSFKGIYLNGTEITTGTASDGTGSLTQDFYIGRRNDGRYHRGEIDDFRVYSRVLSQSEIQTLAHGDSPTGSLTTGTRTATDSTTPTQLRTTSSLGGGSIDIVVSEDTDQDGTAENSQTVTLAGGTDETNSLSGFAGGSGVDYWADIDMTVSAPTDTAPTLDKAEIVRE